MTAIEPLLCAAMRELHQVQISYRTDPVGTFRVVEPYVLYLVNEGEPLVDVFQVFGPSSAPLPSWKTLFISRITRIEIRERTFTPHSEYVEEARKSRPNRHCWVGMNSLH